MYTFIAMLLIWLVLFYFGLKRENAPALYVGFMGCFLIPLLFFVLLLLPDFQTAESYELNPETIPYYQILGQEIIVKVKEESGSTLKTFKKYPIITEVSLNGEPAMLVQHRRSDNKWKLFDKRYVFLLPELENK